ncbi:MAG: hypothetical protein GY839_07200 [candidate division Zixibacteria bacterium]|nr:hypothetical protein [candidate division Zixibacteria bacterium]
MLATTEVKKENKFQATLEYLGEYHGVQNAVIFDSNGLVVGYLDRDGLDAELLSPFALLILDQISSLLVRLDEAPVKSMMLKNDSSWIIIERVENLILAVRAGKETDELLKVRIGRSIDMIKDCLKKNYPQVTR